MSISTNIKLFPKILITVFLGLLLAETAVAQNTYLIEGNVRGLDVGDVIILMKNEGSVLTTVASDTVRNAHFRFSGVVDELTEFAIIGTGDGFPSQWLEIWLKPGAKVSIEGNNKLLKTWKVKSDIPEQKAIAIYTKASGVMLDRLQQLSAEEQPWLDQLQNATPETLKKIKSNLDSLRKQQDSLRAIININKVSLLFKTKHDRIWLSTLKELSMFVKYGSDSSLRTKVVQLYGSLSPEENNTFAATEIRNYLFPPVVVKIGEKMADTILRDLNNKPHSLADYKGKYLLIDFWSIGCGPCIAAMPELKKIHETMSDRLTVISFNTDQKLETWRKGTEYVKMNWLNLSDGKGNTGLAAKYGVNGIPHYVIISPEGTLVDSWVGYSDGLVTKKLQQFLK